MICKCNLYAELNVPRDPSCPVHGVKAIKKLALQTRLEMELERDALVQFIQVPVWEIEELLAAIRPIAESRQQGEGGEEGPKP